MSRSSAISRSWIAGVGVCVLAALICSPTARGQNIQTFDVWAGDGIARGPDGAMWFSIGHNVGRIDLSGFVTTFPLPADAKYPAGIALGSDGNLWIADYGAGHIYRLTATGAVVEYEGLSSSPYAITAGPDGALWFTEPIANKIGRITTSGTITEFSLPTPLSNLVGISAGPDGNLWFARGPGSSVYPSTVGRLTTSGVVTEFPLPQGTYAVAIAPGTDGNIWFTKNVANVGRISPSGEIAEFPVTKQSRGIAAGADGNLWLTSWGQLSRITPEGAVTDYSVPLYFPNPLGIAVGPEGSIWITDDINGFGRQIVRFTLQSPSQCLADATTLCVNGERFRVTANWRAPDGSTGVGRASPLTANTGSFWFFDPANLELIVKVLNGCSGNGNFWMFAAGLTNVEVVLKVTDTWTGESREYANAQGIAFAPIQDTAAFTTCP